MCLTLPAQIRSVNAENLSSLVDLSGEAREVRLGFSEIVLAGDWVLVNADLAVSKISPQEAEEIKEYLC